MSRKALAAGCFHRPAASALRLTNVFSTRMAESRKTLTSRGVFGEIRQFPRFVSQGCAVSFRVSTLHAERHETNPLRTIDHVNSLFSSIEETTP